jgi:4-amino-4-deoxy-L-arabinose transferase-like glycosyltransferase
MTRLAIIVSILAIAVRLIWIDQAYIDNWSWRQSDVAAIARNYFQGDFHFSRPQIDWAGDQPGYVGTEFPILPFLAAICYKVFGVHEWVGRIQGVILFALSLPFFFLLLRELVGETAAVWALFFYSFAPLEIMASRCFMPDTPSLALSIIGLYFFWAWLAKSELATGRVRPIGGPDWRTRSTFLIASACCISLSILIKLPSVLIGAPLAYLACQRFRLSAFRNFKLWIFAAIALVPSILWYWHAYEIALNFYPHHFFGAGGIKIMPAAWYLRTARLIVTSTLTPFVFVLGGVGVFITRSSSRPRIFHCWLMVMILFTVVVGYGNRHQWYQLPLVPIASAFAGAACAFISTKIKARPVGIGLAFVLVVSFGFASFVYTQRFYRPSAAAVRDAGLKLKSIASENALIVAADNGDPTVLYYAGHKGWHFLEKDGIYDGEPRDSEQAITDLEQLRRRGARYLVFTSDTSWWLDYYRDLAEEVDSTAALIAATPEFRIYELKPSQR